MPRRETVGHTADAGDLAPASISFRLDEASRRVLGERAARLGVSAHELARNHVIEALQAGEERTSMREGVLHLAEQMAKLREDVALVAEALLVSAGKTRADEAREWVEENLERS